MITNLAVFSIFTFFLVITAFVIKKSWVRVVFMLFILLLIIGSSMFSIDAAARRVIADSVHSGSYTNDFGNGVRSLLNALIPTQIAFIVFGVGLFIISLINKQEDAGGKPDKRINENHGAEKSNVLYHGPHNR